MGATKLDVKTAETKTWSELFDFLLTKYANDPEAVEYIKGEQTDYEHVAEPRRWQLTFDLVSSMGLYY